jgi:hypothetical protein
MSTLDEAVTAPVLPAVGASPAHDGGHGHTPAAWTAVLLCIVGFLVGGAGLVASAPAVAVVGGALALLSPVIGKVLSAMGLGAPVE